MAKNDAARIAELESKVVYLTQVRDTLKNDLHRQQRMNEDIRRERDSSVDRAQARERALTVRMIALKRMLEAAQVLADDENRTVNSFRLHEGR